MALLLGWLIASLLVAWIAGERGRSVVAWFFVSLFISPILGVLALIACPVLPKSAVVKRPWTKLHTRATQYFAGFAVALGIAFALMGADHMSLGETFLFVGVILFWIAIVYIWFAWAPAETASKTS